MDLQNVLLYLTHLKYSEDADENDAILLVSLIIEIVSLDNNAVSFVNVSFVKTKVLVVKLSPASN